MYLLEVNVSGNVLFRLQIKILSCIYVREKHPEMWTFIFIRLKILRRQRSWTSNFIFQIQISHSWPLNENAFVIILNGDQSLIWKKVIVCNWNSNNAARWWAIGSSCQATTIFTYFWRYDILTLGYLFTSVKKELRMKSICSYFLTNVKRYPNVKISWCNRSWSISPWLCVYDRIRWLLSLSMARGWSLISIVCWGPRRPSYNCRPSSPKPVP